MCQHLTAPTFHQILYITMVMWCCTNLEENDRQHAQAVLTAYGEQLGSTYSVRVSSNIGHWPS
jgi:hypothetical protein